MSYVILFFVAWGWGYLVGRYEDVIRFWIGVIDNIDNEDQSNEGEK